MKNQKIRAIEETEYGVYVWADSEGKILADDEFRPLSVPSKKGDMTKVMALKRVAFELLKDMGLPQGGGPVFWAGRRQISDSEYEEQKMRQDAGLVPDKYDFAAIKEEAKYAKQHGK
jgi:hypothetical protein